MSDEYPIKRLCAVFAVSRSGYYAWSQAPVSARRQREQQLRTKIALVHQQSRETYGSPRVTIELQSQGEQVGRHRVARLMHEAGLRGRQKRRYRVRTTDSAHSHPIAPNRLATLPPPTKPNQVWVTDLTYVATWAGVAYVCFIVDAFSRRIVGWSVASHMRTDMVLEALQMAAWQRGTHLTGLRCHSDAGSQFTSIRYGEHLAELGAVPSIGSVGDSYDNALAETVNGLYKTECIRGPAAGPWRNVGEVELATLAWVHWFNHQRLHSYLADIPPAQFEAAFYAAQQPAPARVGTQ